MEHLCLKCNTEMKKAKLEVYMGITVRKENSKLFDHKESKVGCYVCPTCGYIEYYAERPEIFK